MSYKIGSNKYLNLGLDICAFLAQGSNSKYEVDGFISYQIKPNDLRSICCLDEICYSIQISADCANEVVIEQVEKRLNEFPHPCPDSKLLLTAALRQPWDYRAMKLEIKTKY
ncbi:hypothetical protein [Snodgrassella alvi]|uniref:Uncharacterized protein n=1 Tax=Snodgrassella alvi TaxID=1196083 RepID=A0A2N9Y0R3_9NEIS|nr:hypothetical protein [Snodgrassella alvi]PIT58360.1 hypothetical protein BHC49_01775 [Snodgrassella alvi]